MNKLVFAIAGAGAILLSGCGSKDNQDAVNNAEMNQPSVEDLNQAASDAANIANESAALAAQQNKLDEAVPTDNATNPTDAQEQNVSGM
jgi:hypothetical protein